LNRADRFLPSAAAVAKANVNQPVYYPRPMKTISLLVLLLLLCAISSYGQSTAFTYQGRLNDSTGAANGSYDLRFAVQGDPTANVPLGQPRTNSAVTVSNGLFTTVVDFGSIWDGTPMWLEIGVRPGGSANFTNISPRQLVNPTPKATYANRAGSYAGPIDVTQLPAGVVRGYADQTLTGAFTFDPPARVVVPHPLRVAHFLHVVDGNVEPFTEAPGAGVAPGPAAGPLPVDGHQNDCDVGDGGSWFDEGLDTGVLGNPLGQITQVGRGVVTVCGARRTATANSVEQSHLRPAPSRLRAATSFDSARAASH